jgi:hypothetical protein
MKFIASNLCGTVRFSPTNFIAAAPRIASARFSGNTSNAKYFQFNPSASIAALCIAGDAECFTGCPYTAQKRVVAEMVAIGCASVAINNRARIRRAAQMAKQSYLVNSIHPNRAGV